MREGRLTIGMLWLAGSLLTACAAETGSFEPGSLSAQLTLDQNVELGSIVYTLSGGPLGSSLQGSFEPSSGPPFHWAISNLPPGNGYTLDIDARDELGNGVCAGTTGFDVFANDSTFLNVVLICGLSPGTAQGEIEFRAELTLVETERCPVLHSLYVAPTQLEPSAGAQLEVVASEPDAKLLTYSWTASAGSFDGASTSNPVYSCDGATGSQTLSVVVGNGNPLCATLGELKVDCAD